MTKLSVSNQNDWSEALRHLIVHTALTQYYTCMSYSGWVNQKRTGQFESCMGLTKGWTLTNAVSAHLPNTCLQHDTQTHQPVLWYFRLQNARGSMLSTKSLEAVSCFQTAIRLSTGCNSTHPHLQFHQYIYKCLTTFHIPDFMHIFLPFRRMMINIILSRALRIRCLPSNQIQNWIGRYDLNANGNQVDCIVSHRPWRSCLLYDLSSLWIQCCATLWQLCTVLAGL